jgi:vitamin K-dependent gamma-carboxylase
MIRALNRQTDAAALAVFRIGFGLLVAVSAARFLAYGWVATLFVKPRYHFSYFGFGWIPQPSSAVVHGVFALLVVLGLMVAVGLFYRVAIAALFVAFTWVQLLDVSAYLNHYYLVSLLALLLCFIPAHVLWSVDAWRRPGLAASTLPAWCTWLLRFQVAVVYVFAGLAKLTSDWLVEAQPLHIWLSARTDFWLVGPLFAERWVAYVAAWC